MTITKTHEFHRNAPGMEINVAGLHGDVKVIQNEDAFYCNAAIAVPPVAKKRTAATSFIYGFYPARVRKSLALKILVSAAD